MILHNNFTLVCLVISNLLKLSTAHPFKVQIQQDEPKILNSSDKTNLSSQTVLFGPSENVNFKEFSTLWRQLDSYLIKSLNISQAMIDMNKNLARPKQLSTQNSLIKNNNLLINSATTTARPTYNQIPRPMLFDEDFESSIELVTKRKDPYQLPSTTAIA